MDVRSYIKDGVLDLSGSGMTEIEDRAFFSEKTLRRVVLPGDIRHVGNWAFSKCTNLVSVKSDGPFRPGIFGKEVFKGCDLLSSISFSDTEEDCSRLLALCANALSSDHLIRSDDIGQKSWYEKWDICLIDRLKKDDSAITSAALCGEEDISYDGIGSVDGEMPGETDDFVRKSEFDRCRLCYSRLGADIYLNEETKRTITAFICDNRLGKENGAAFYCMFDNSENTAEYLRIYLDTVKPGKDELMEMINAVPVQDVYTRSYLIGKTGSGTEMLDDLLI